MSFGYYLDRGSLSRGHTVNPKHTTRGAASSTYANRADALEAIIRELGRRGDAAKILAAVLKRVSDIFRCERALLLQPCDPQAPAFDIEYEHTAPSSGEATEAETEVPMAGDTARVMAEALASATAVIAGAELRISRRDQPPQCAMLAALHPRTGKPWACVVIRRADAPWREQERLLFQDIALLINTVLNNALLHRSLYDSFQALRVLLSRSTVKDDALRGGLDALRALVGARYGALALFDENGETSYFCYSGVSQKTAERIGRLPVGDGMLGIAVRENKTLKVDDVAHDPRFTGFPPHHPDVHSLLVVPINHHREVSGRAYLSDKLKGEPFTEDDRLLAEGFADSLSLMLECVDRREAARRAEGALAQREGELQAIFDATPDGLSTAARDGTVLNINVQGAAMLGAESPERLIGSSLYERVAPQDRAATRALAEKVFAGEAQILEASVVGLAEERHRVDIKAVPLRDDGEIIAMLVLMRDITEREKVAEVLHVLAALTPQQTSEAFLCEAVAQLARLYETPFVSIGVYADQSKSSIRTLVVWCEGTIADNLTYELRGTPCQDVLDGTLELVAEGAQQRYPDDAFLALWGVESYFGRPLIGSNDEPFGVVSVMHTQPMRLTSWSRPVLRTFANRLAAELERLRSEQALRESEAQLAEAQRVAHIGNWQWDIDADEVTWSDELYRIYGLKRDECEASYEGLLAWVHPEDREYFNSVIQEAARTHQPFSFYHRIVRPDGTERIVQGRGQVIADETGRAMRMFGTAQDVTDLKRAEAERQLAASVFGNMSEGVVIADPEGTILRVNPAFTAVTGYESGEVVGRNIVRSERHDETVFQRMTHSLKACGHWQGEIWNRRKNGEIYPEWLSISAVRDDSDRVTHYIGVFNDITEKKLSEERIRRLAQYDPLTELPNRRLFHDRLDQARVHAHRNQGWLSLLYLDLDRFKSVNDSFGHAVGDRLLQEVARRLQCCVRESDTVARLGGDEFTIILGGFKDAEQALAATSHVAEKIIEAIEQPHHLNGHEITVTTSIGAALYPQDGVTQNDLVRNADTAMFHAKAEGRSRLQFYSSEMNARARDRLIMENRLRRALTRKEFLLHYQPQVDGRSGRIAGVEALLRWRDPNRGIIPPAEFIPLAENAGLIIPLGEWVLREACGQLRAWHDAGHQDLRVSVNISPLQFRQRDLGGAVAAVLSDTQAPLASLELELTETALMNHRDSIMATLDFFNELGVSIALDDFGTGYSSLGNLKRIPLHTLKIDRSFVHEVPDNAGDAAITLTIICLARRLDLRVIAEGVETQRQLAFLREQGCHYMQGYLFAKPVAADEITHWLEQDRVLV